MIAQTT